MLSVLLVLGEEAVSATAGLVASLLAQLYSDKEAWLPHRVLPRVCRTLDCAPDGTITGETRFHHGDEMPFTVRHW